MVNEEKKRIRIERANARRKRRMSKYVSKIDKAVSSGVPQYVPLFCAVDQSNSWPDSGSPTGYSQVCEWQGICQSPCNGDC